MSELIDNRINSRCRRCGRPAVVRVKYAKLTLCREHFLEYVEERVLKSIKRYSMLNGVRRILVALSGGKDSLSLFYILHSIRDKVGLEHIIGFHIDLGLGSFSIDSKKAVETACNELRSPCIIISLKDLLGYTLPELVEKTHRPPCSLCGLIKRYLVNLVSVELGVDAVSLGHHLDDILPYAVKDFLIQDTVDLAKMTPIIPGYPGLVSRKLKILYEIYEDDLESYAKLRGIKTVEAHCPFSYVDPLKEASRKMLDELEEKAPGFKISVARRLANNPITQPSGNEIIPCRYCGMPSKNGVCGICKLTTRIHGRPIGGEIRYKVREYISSMKIPH